MTTYWLGGWWVILNSPQTCLHIWLRFNLSLQVYQRADLNKMLMSMSVGPYCDLSQDVDSENATQGAVISLVMDENERECKFDVLVHFLKL